MMSRLSKAMTRSAMTVGFTMTLISIAFLIRAIIIKEPVNIGIWTFNAVLNSRTLVTEYRRRRYLLEEIEEVSQIYYGGLVGIWKMNNQPEE